MTAAIRQRPSTFRAPSEASLRLFRRLVSERQVPAWGATVEERAAAAEGWLAEDRPDQRALSARIDSLMRAERDRARPADPELVPGVYEVDGVVYVVKPNRARTALYAKRLVEIGGRRMTESGEVANIEFVYAPGAVKLVRPEHRMTAERARTLTLVYGRCLNCGRALKDARSVERGIGPVCWKAFA